LEWDESSNSPLAYTSKDRKWGLVRNSNTKWELHLLNNGKSLKRAAIFDKNKVPPFEDAEKEVMKYNQKRSGSKWSEVVIGERTPGEEGRHGGMPISMQTTRRGRR
jgi:hypothetical protein